MYSFFERLHRWSVTHPWLTISLWLIAVAAGGTGLVHMRLDANYRSFFAVDDPLVASLDSMRDTYESGDTTALLIKSKHGDLFNQNGLAAVEMASDEAWKLPDSIRVESLANFPYTTGGDDELIVRDLVSDAAELSDEEIKRIRDYALDEPLLRYSLVNPRGDSSLVVVTFDSITGVSLEASMAIYYAALELCERVEAAHKGVRCYPTGTVAGTAAFTLAASSDGETLVPIGLAFALFAIFAYLWVESGRISTSLSGAGASLAIITVSVLIPMGLMGWAGITANNITGIIPVIILTLAVADSLHILISYFQLLRDGKPQKEALLESLRLNAEPVWLTSVTTTLGFLALNNSDSPPFQHMGNLVAIGVVLAWAGSNTLLPAILSLCPAKVSENRTTNWDPMPALAGLVIRYRGLVVAVGIAALLFSVYGIQQNRLNEAWSGYISESTVFGNATKEVLESFVDINVIEYDISSGKEGGIYELVYLNDLARLAEWLRSQPEVLYVQALDVTLKRLNKNIHGDDPVYERMPANEVEAAQYLLLYEMSLPFGASMTNQVSFDKSSTRLLVGLYSSDTAIHLGFQKRVARWFEENAPHLAHPGTGGTTIMANLAHRDAIAMLWGTGLVLLVISISVAIVFRSFAYGLLTMFVNAIPGVVALGIWGITVGTVGLSVSMVFAASLGIIVDYGVHFLSKYRRARIERQLSAEQAVHYAFSTVGVALLVTTAVLVLNFSVLGFSDFLLNVYMGVLTALTIVLALFSQLLFLPSLLLIFQRFQK